ncbi:hypothetical protein BB561_000573 [Smittium simulii]|uniref:Vacuolar protein sorting 55 n=1 Tax=Smittium simulii TaxID=133385 RepID=A0A2T9YYK5_9FUNG|nr:hypothetical protein BB561_000573 [Smittium simulii]
MASQINALGFLLSFLSCALYGNWLPLISVILFVLTPLPNSIFGNYTTNDVLEDSVSHVADVGRFLTAVLMVSALALPITLLHVGIINSSSAFMSISGGLLIYSTMMIYSSIVTRNEVQY